MLFLKSALERSYCGVLHLWDHLVYLSWNPSQSFQIRFISFPFVSLRATGFSFSLEISIIRWGATVMHGYLCWFSLPNPPLGCNLLEKFRVFFILSFLLPSMALACPDSIIQEHHKKKWKSSKIIKGLRNMQSPAFGNFPTPCHAYIQAPQKQPSNIIFFPLNQIIWAFVTFFYLLCLNRKVDSVRTAHVMFLGKPRRGSSTPVMETSVAIPKEGDKWDWRLHVSDRCYSTPLTREVMSICPVYYCCTPWICSVFTPWPCWNGRLWHTCRKAYYVPWWLELDTRI